MSRMIVLAAIIGLATVRGATQDLPQAAYISPDSRWIVSDPLEVVDVRNWRKYRLSKSFKVEPYIIPRAISADGRRLFISRQPCPFDCQNLPHEYFEIGFP